MTVLVAMPYFGCPDHVGRAVESVLAQTYRDLVCVVLGDGQAPPPLPSDPRLVVHTMSANRGTYFARQVMLLASPFEWHAPVDADDWIDPEHLEVMFAHLDGTQAAVPRKVRGWVAGRGPRVYGAGRYHVGLIGTDRMRAFGGYDPAERIGADTLMLRLLRLTGEVRSVTEPVTYNRVRRPDSLTMAPTTKHGSPGRREMQERNRDVFRHCRQLRTADAIRAWRESRLPPDLAAALTEEVATLRARLADAVAVAA